MSHQRSPSAIRAFLAGEASGGILLMAAAALALVTANSAVAEAYFRMLSAHLGPLTVLHWVNDGLMAVFFFLVGLEIKREFTNGHLATWSDRRLPIISAFAGIVLPAIVYLTIAREHPDLVRGWAIPAATDIAFALGVLALLGSRAPASLKLFLTTVAIVDDMGAVAIIAIAYTAKLNLIAMFVALGLLIAMGVLNRRRVTALWPYLLLSLCLWLAVFLSGVHATIAGVLAAFMTPIGSGKGHDSPLVRLEHALHPWVSYAIVPIFGFANAGVSFAGMQLSSLVAPLPVAIALGLFLGKQIGIFGSIRICVALKVAKKPRNASWLQIYGVAVLCGIGFTMSLFIGALAFSDPVYMDGIKLGVLMGSVMSAILGFLILRAAPANAPRQTG